MTQYKIRLRHKAEREQVRRELADICRAAGFFSTHQNTVPSPPQLLRFIVAHADEFIEWKNSLGQFDEKT